MNLILFFIIFFLFVFFFSAFIVNAKPGFISSSRSHIVPLQHINFLNMKAKRSKKNYIEGIMQTASQSWNCMCKFIHRVCNVWFDFDFFFAAVRTRVPSFWPLHVSISVCPWESRKRAHRPIGCVVQERSTIFHFASNKKMWHYLWLVSVSVVHVSERKKRRWWLVRLTIRYVSYAQLGDRCQRRYTVTFLLRAHFPVCGVFFSSVFELFQSKINNHTQAVIKEWNRPHILVSSRSARAAIYGNFFPSE